MSTAVDAALLTPGFRHAVFDAQAVFRAALSGLSRPGIAVTVDVALSPPAPLDVATGALALALLDADTPVWLDAGANAPAVQAFLRFHCGCPLADTPERAAFAIVTDATALPALDHFDSGDEQYPDQSCTLIVQLPSLEGGGRATLSGPGVDGSLQAAPRGLPPDFARRWAVNRALYPRGIDLILTSGNRLLGLPRSVDWRQS